MKKSNLVLILFLFYLGCENEDQTPENSSPPSSVTVSLSNNVLTWTMNDDDDFSKYSLIGSIKIESPRSGMPEIWDTLLYETQTRLDTSYTLDSSEFYSTYQINVTNNSDVTASIRTSDGYSKGQADMWVLTKEDGSSPLYRVTLYKVSSSFGWAIVEAYYD